MATHTKSRSVKTALDGAIVRVQRLYQWLYQRLMPTTESAEYQAWRQQFMRDRIRLAWWITCPCFLTIVAVNVYVLFFNASQFDADMAKFYGSASIGGLARQLTIASSIVMGLCLFTCLGMQRIRWFQRRPVLLFLALTWSTTLSEQIVSTFFGLPAPPNWTLQSLGQALLIPVCWRLHLLSQLVPTAYYAIVNPLFGLTKIGERSIYSAYSIGTITNLLWVCLICNLAVYLYERLKRSEFEVQRQLKVFLHSVSHDLRNPVMGTSIVLNNLLKQSEQRITLDRSVLERFRQGNDRQLTLINSLLEAHNTEIQGVQVACKPLALQDVIKSVLSDLLPVLEQHQITLQDYIPSNLPLILGDAHQLWRVYCNLITNAVKHNPNGIMVTLTAEVVESEERRKKPFQPKLQCLSKKQWLRCSVHDTGVGIEPQHCQSLFDLYARGSRARYMPGLGLGLYLCKQIITAHGGQMGVISDRGKGATFWFTLPLA
jgi:nitrogen-specific signal transduction histidine kinase